MGSNPFILAADNSPALLPLLEENPEIASKQDEHGYSLIHAAASYNHLDLLRQLSKTFKVDVNLKDEDGETALFVCETVDAARVLTEELGADITIKGIEGQTAREKIAAEADFPAVASYLGRIEAERSSVNGITASGSPPLSNAQNIPPPPPGMSLTVGTINEDEAVPNEVDPEFKRRIEELAAREDYNTPEGQADLRRLVEDVIGHGIDGEERHVRQRQN